MASLRNERRNASKNKQNKRTCNKKKFYLKKQGLVQKMDRKYSVRFTLQNPGLLGMIFIPPHPNKLFGIDPPVIQIKGVGFAWPNQDALFENLELNLDCKSRVAITGPNGSGKSTLMELILGNVEPTSGEVQRKRFFSFLKRL